MTDDDLQGRVQAVEICISEGEWARAEEGLLDALSEVRKRKAGGTE